MYPFICLSILCVFIICHLLISINNDQFSLKDVSSYLFFPLSIYNIYLSNPIFFVSFCCPPTINLWLLLLHKLQFFCNISCNVTSYDIAYTWTQLAHLVTIFNFLYHFLSDSNIYHSPCFYNSQYECLIVCLLFVWMSIILSFLFILMVNWSFLAN